MKNNTIRIATRKSQLALWQANWVKERLLAQHPNLNVVLHTMLATGDQHLDIPLTDIGGKSVFVKNLQQALLNDEADIAVHCVKDMSVHPTARLMLSAICERADPRDVFVSNTATTLFDLPPNPIIGTASPRRASLILSLRKDANIRLLRGNVNTRLQKLDHKEYDAIILAAAGLHRLGLSQRIRSYLPPDTFVPAIGQGALAIECREDDVKTQTVTQFLNHPSTAVCISAEKAVNQTLNGDCHTPIGAYATVVHDQIHLRAVVGGSDGQNILRTEAIGAIKDANQLGFNAAKDLLDQGAKALIDVK